MTHSGLYHLHVHCYEIILQISGCLKINEEIYPMVYHILNMLIDTQT